MTQAPRSDVAPPDARLGFLIYRAGLAVAQAYADRMRPSGLTPGEVGVLTQLASYGPGHIREIGRALGVSPQTVVNLGRSLEAKQMVRHANSMEDRRTVLLSITEKGRETLDKADRIARAFDRAIEAAIGSDATATARALRMLLDQHSNWSIPVKD